MAGSVTFQGGPCNGKVEELTDAQLAPGVTSCGGIQYTIVGTSPGLYTAIPSSSAVQGGTSIQDITADVFAGYHDLQNALGRSLRPALDRARRNDAVALRLLSRRARVKGH